MVVIRDEERRGRVRLRLSASHDESSDNDSTSLYEAVGDKHFIFLVRSCSSYVAISVDFVF